MSNLNKAITTETGYGPQFDAAQSALDQFIAEKADAVKNGKNPIDALLTYVEHGLPMSAELLSELARREHSHVVELIDNAVTEMTATARVQQYLIDESTIRDLNLLAGLAIDQSHTALNAIDDCINSNQGSHIRFAVKTLEVYADRYEKFIELVESLPLTEEIGAIWKEVSYNHSMLSFAQMSLQNHIDWQRAQAKPSRQL